ncbi:MAG TPA: hypothetical protein VJX67_13160 [Blastocatellia bacterium]|nr:hypothetical protein [Blastocatellia bacterium]
MITLKNQRLVKYAVTLFTAVARIPFSPAKVSLARQQVKPSPAASAIRPQGPGDLTGAVLTIVVN